MQVRVIDGGDVAYRALMYATPTQAVSEYLQSNMSRLGDVIGSVGHAFVETGISMYNKFNSNAAIQAAKNILHSTGGYSSEYQIQLLNASNIHTANYITQQYIMCQPDLNKLYKDDMCDGFSGTYYDKEPGVYGVDREDYAQVMTGVMQYDEDGAGYVKHYSLEEELDLSDKLAVLDTWEHVKSMISQGIDPSDVNGGDL